MSAHWNDEIIARRTPPHEDSLTHYGVKGMEWNKHKVKTEKGQVLNPVKQVHKQTPTNATDKSYSDPTSHNYLKPGTETAKGLEMQGYSKAEAEAIIAKRDAATKTLSYTVKSTDELTNTKPKTSTPKKTTTKTPVSKIKKAAAKGSKWVSNLFKK